MTGGRASDAAADEVPTGAEPAWRQRAIERSTQSARLRAAKRVQRFLNAAREIISEKGSTEFTVQEVVDRSKQSLRSFYQYFDGKHELLLGLFEEEIDISVERMRAVSAEGDPLERLHAAVVLLFELCSPNRDPVQPLFWDFAQRLHVDHPTEVEQAYAPQFDCLAEIVQDAGDDGLLRAGRPRRHATIVMQTVIGTATRVGGAREHRSQPVTAEEVWDFCLHAIVADDVLAARRTRKATPARAATKRQPKES